MPFQKQFLYTVLVNSKTRATVSFSKFYSEVMKEIHFHFHYSKGRLAVSYNGDF